MRKLFFELIFVLTAAIGAASNFTPARAGPAGPIGLEMKSWLGAQGPSAVHYRRRHYDHYVHRHYYAPRYYRHRVYDEYAPPAVVYYPPPVVYYPPPVVRRYYGPPVAYDDVDVDVEYTSRPVSRYYTDW